EAEERDRLVSFLKEKGVETMLPWGGRGVHQFKALGLSHFNLPRTDAFFQKALMVPMNPELSDNEVEYVSESIREFYQSR
ncbi:MAG TPA: DegT/DnrJ/EryC1/StrS family aminotransferase, partial [Nitrospiria bacterium]|nr:DegT/DnrJ/EryC1/StrS family aminotransferase [Nitrospiria bacterium]